MILAAADSGQYGEPPGELLELALDCVRHKTMPRAGGIWEQPAGLMEKLRILHNVHDSYYDMVNTSMDQQKWTEAYPGKFSIVARVGRMRSELEDG